MGVMKATDQVTIVEGAIGDTTELEAKVEELNNNLTAKDSTKFRFATDGEGNYGYLKADDSFVPFKKESAKSLNLTTIDEWQDYTNFSILSDDYNSLFFSEVGSATYKEEVQLLNYIYLFAIDNHTTGSKLYVDISPDKNNWTNVVEFDVSTSSIGYLYNIKQYANQGYKYVRVRYDDNSPSVHSATIKGLVVC